MIEKKFYTQDFYKYIGQSALESAKIIAPLILDLISCNSVVDVGCGNGAWLKIFKDLGVNEILGIDGDYVDENTLVIPKKNFLAFDLKAPITIANKFDLVLSLEVAEHLPPSSAEVFVDSLTRLGPVVLFSAAIPLQGGENHINEQWPNYWFNLFASKDYVAIDCIREKVWNDDKVAYWYRQNLFLLVNKTYLAKSERLKWEFDRKQSFFEPVVHPKTYLAAKNKLTELESTLKEVIDLEHASLRRTLNFGFKLVKRDIQRFIRKIVSSTKNAINSSNQILEESVRSLILEFNIKHIYGPRALKYEKDELIVTCVVRNGEFYIESFIDHHFSLGVKHIVFLDNGSTDKTVEIAKKYNNVTILQTFCSYGKYETLMKKYLVGRYSKKRWNLFVDIDELFDYPFSRTISIKALLGYLNKQGYTAVAAQMLDMFSKEGLASSVHSEMISLREKYKYYDINSIKKKTFLVGVPGNKEIKSYYGGIRNTLFGTNNGLTKVPLVFLGKGVNPFVAFHYAEGVVLADFTSVLLHYPFTEFFQDKVQEAVENKRYLSSAHHQYKLYWEKLKLASNFSLSQETLRELNDIESLIDNNFLVVSELYLQYAKSFEKYPEKPDEF